MSSDTLLSSEPLADEPPLGGASPAIARLVTVLLLIIVPIMIGGIFWRWATVHGPTAAVIIRGDASLEGATIAVSGPGKNWTLGLARENTWQTPILLDPGVYHLTVSHHDRNILKTDFSVENLHGVAYDLPSMVWLIGNSQLSNSRIEISRLSIENVSFTPIEVDLTADNHYRTAKYLPAGVYQVTARSIMTPHPVIAQVDFTVTHTGELPLHVDLAKAATEEWQGGGK